MKKIIPIVILIMLVGFFIWNQRASFEDPIGTYINESNVRDTICLFSTGRFEQVVYDKAGRLIYHCKSKWRKTSHGIAIDSILLYDNLSSLNVDRQENKLYEGMSYDGFQPSYKNGRFIISWNDYVDTPGSAISFYRIRTLTVLFE